MQLFTLIASLSELFVLTVERPSQQAILTTSAPPQPCTVRIGWWVRRGGPKASATPRSRRFLFLLCRATYAFDMRIKGWKLHSCNTATPPPLLHHRHQHHHYTPNPSQPPPLLLLACTNTSSCCVASKLAIFSFQFFYKLVGDMSSGPNCLSQPQT